MIEVSARSSCHARCSAASSPSAASISASDSESSDGGNYNANDKVNSDEEDSFYSAFSKVSENVRTPSNLGLGALLVCTGFYRFCKFVLFRFNHLFRFGIVFFRFDLFSFSVFFPAG